MKDKKNRRDKKVIFISHSSKDRDKVTLLVNFIEKICAKQFKNQYEVYYAPINLSRSFGTSSTDSEIISHIKKAKVFIVFYTPNAVFSRWVHFETGVALSRGKNLRIIPFIKYDIDASSLIGNIPRVSMEDPDSIRKLLYKMFSESGNQKDVKLEWINSYKRDMAELHYALKTKRVYIVGSKALAQNTNNAPTNEDSHSEQSKPEDDELWNTDRANRFVRNITEGLIATGVKLASFPNVPTIGNVVANLCLQHEYADNYEIAGLYSFDDSVVKVDLPKQIFKDTILRYRKAYLEHMDVQIIIGGNINTQNEYEATSEVKSLQVIPIPCFGGTAYRIFEEMKKLKNWSKYEHPCMGCPMSERDRKDSSEYLNSHPCMRIDIIIERTHRYIPLGISE